MRHLPFDMLRNDKDLFHFAIGGLAIAIARIFMAMIVNMSGEGQHCDIVSDEELVDHMGQGAVDIASDDDENEGTQHPSRSEFLSRSPL